MSLYVRKCIDSCVLLMKGEIETVIVRSKWKSKIPRKASGKKDRDYAGGEIMIDNNCLKSEYRWTMLWLDGSLHPAHVFQILFPHTNGTQRCIFNYSAVNDEFQSQINSEITLNNSWSHEPITGFELQMQHIHAGPFTVSTRCHNQFKKSHFKLIKLHQLVFQF